LTRLDEAGATSAVGLVGVGAVGLVGVRDVGLVRAFGLVGVGAVGLVGVDAVRLVGVGAVGLVGAGAVGLVGAVPPDFPRSNPLGDTSIACLRTFLVDCCFIRGGGLVATKVPISILSAARDESTFACL